MSMKDRKRDWKVVWGEWGNIYYRLYYRKHDAVNFLEKLKTLPNVEVHDEIIDLR